MAARNSDTCIFCAIGRGKAHANIVYEDELTVAFVDLRQFNPGHMLVIPRAHFADVRELDARTCAALMASVAKVTRAVGNSFPNEGLSLWHSIGPAAFQEVPHLHFHVHPRRTNDGLLRVYPHDIATTDAGSREHYAELVREALARADT
jgi:histidine triad (HIT) family protein